MRLSVRKRKNRNRFHSEVSDAVVFQRIRVIKVPEPWSTTI